MDNPLYFNNLKFVFPDRTEFVAGQKTIQSHEINNRNILLFASQLAAPYSLLASLISGRNYCLIGGSGKVCFYDIETDDKENFLFGYVNDRYFDSAEEMCREIMNYDVVCAFNCFRFDNELLFKAAPEFFDTISFGRFKVHFFRGKINLDLLFFYQLWKPYNNTHKLAQLAADLGIEKQFDLSNKEEKCKEDIAVLEKFYPYAAKIYNFLVSEFKMDYLSFSTLPAMHFGKLRRWLLQSYMLQNNTLPYLFQKDTAETAEYFMMHRKGYYENVNHFDIKSAYPNAGIKLNCTLYRENDFSNYLKKLVELRGHYKDIEESLKYIANATIGDMGSSQSLVRDKKIMIDIRKEITAVMKEWVRKVRKKNVIYAYVDGFITKLEKVPLVEGYETRLKAHYDWLVIYNQQRMLMKEANAVKRIQFQKQFPSLKLFGFVDKQIDILLLNGYHKEFLKKPVLNGLKIDSLPEEFFKLVVRKDDDVCRVPDYFEFWDDLEFGFNEIFLAKNGFSLKKPYIPKYRKIVNDYLRQYRMKINMV